jgi:ABC-type lipoprotein export system ATPase subunit
MNKIEVDRMNAESIITTRELSKYYKSADTVVKALDGVSLSFPRGRMTAIRGSSGSGKTTLLNLIGTFDKPSSLNTVSERSVSFSNHIIWYRI